MNSDLIRKILREEAEMSEMGISIKKVKQFQPSNYLIQTLKNKEKEILKKNKLKIKIEECDNLYEKLNQKLKNISWQEIQLYEKEKFIMVRFPTDIRSDIRLIAKMYDKINNLGQENLLKYKTKIETIYLDFSEQEIDRIYFYLDEPKNRTHFPAGLPPSLLGYNLGYKLYRKLLNYLGFIQSAQNATEEIHNIYLKLSQLPDVDSIFYKEMVLLIEKDLDVETTREIVRNSILQYYIENYRYDKKLRLSRDILLSSNLMSKIGHSNFNRMIDDEIKNVLNPNKIPFKGLGHKVRR